MRKTNVPKADPASIPCVEIVISRSNALQTSDHMFRILSLYSLHNHAVPRNTPMACEVFHFMVYDWRRTIRHMLESRSVPYHVVQYFAPDRIYYDALVEDLSEAVGDADSVGSA